MNRGKKETWIIVAVVCLLALGTLSTIAVAQTSVQNGQTGEPNDDRANATPLSFEPTSVEGITEASVSGFENQSSPAVFGPGDDEDWYSFHVEAGEAIRAWGAGGVAVSGINATLVGPDGEVLTTIGLYSIAYTSGTVAEESGTYYIHIMNNTALGSVEYGLTVQVAENQLEPNDNRDSATPVTP